MGELLTLWTIRVSLALYGLVVVTLLWPHSDCATARSAAAAQEADKREITDEAAWLRWAWLISCLFFLAHVGFAFHFYHEWSHARAYHHTANETERLLGMRVGAGIYCNHLFAILWLMDALLWVAGPTSYRRRPASLNAAVHGYMFFIAFNGAVIFEDGPVRWAGIAVTALIVWLLILKFYRRPERDSNLPAPAGTPEPS